MSRLSSIPASEVCSCSVNNQCEVVRLCQCHSKAVWTTLMSVPVLNSAGVLHGHQSRTSWRQKGATLEKIKSEKNFEEREVMYIADLVRNLPPAYLVGVWEIIEEKPFLESQEKEIEINFSQLKTKKIREIESYVKRKHNTFLTSR